MSVTQKVSQNDTRRFFESLVMLRTLEPPIVAAGRPKYTPWHRFLDYLCQLLDTKPGGRTVTSIAVQNQGNSTIFWLASNRNDPRSELKSLQVMLRCLTGAVYKAAQQHELVKNQLLQKSVEDAHHKIRNYIGRLESFLEQQIGIEEGRIPSLSVVEASGSDNTNLRALLQRVGTICEAASHIDACRRAREFRTTGPYYGQLQSKVNNAWEEDQWCSIRHYIGRLASWVKSSHYVVDFAVSHPAYLKFVEVRTVPPMLPLLTFPKKPRVSVINVFKRILPWRNPHQCHGAAANAASPDFAKKFMDIYSQSSPPKIHAEVAVIQHFFQNKLDFLHDDPYIGCSKPSCYCCALYLKEHPLEVTTRPSHGNVWTKWSPPLPSPSNSDKDLGQQATIVQALTNQIQNDIVARIFNGKQGKARATDSVTDLTSTLHPWSVRG